jgi:hypothetical protein
MKQKSVVSQLKAATSAESEGAHSRFSSSSSFQFSLTIVAFYHKSKWSFLLLIATLVVDVVVVLVVDVTDTSFL